MLELLSPAGSFESISAAVLNGADAVYLGLSEFNARRNAKNFTREELLRAVEYCHVRGAKVYVTLNTLLTDRELEQAAETAAFVNRSGADAVLVQDLGVLRMVKMAAPSLPVHASTQMSVHNLEGVRFAHGLGVSRVVLARELTKEQIAYICRHSPIEIEVFAHGSLCACYSGQCYFSSLIGRRSGNRGLCAQPCRLPYRFMRPEETYSLSLKDLALARHLNELAEMGVAAVKIEGRMKRPEYVALTARIYSAAIREKRGPTRDELAALEAAFSRQGFTDGYYEGKKGPGMFGVHEIKEDEHTKRLFAAARASYRAGQEAQRVGVRFYCLVREGRPVALAAEDENGNQAIAEGEVPQPAYARPILEAEIKTQLYKTGGTPFYCMDARVQLSEGLTLPYAAVNALRRNVLDELMKKRAAVPERGEGEFKPGVKYIARREPPVLTVSVLRAGQISAQLARLHPALAYVPVEEIDASPGCLDPLFAEGVEAAAVLPRVIGDHEGARVVRMLERARSLGVRCVLAGNAGHFAYASAAGLALRGDFGLNVFNSQTLKELKHAGLLSATLSFELNLAQIADLSLCMDSELIVYGRLPLMITENCIIKNRTGQHACENLNELSDRTGARFPLVKAFGCRNEILNSQKLFLADRQEDYAKLGLWGARLSFTTENPLECVQVMERYMGLGGYEPNGYTRGLYYRGAE